MSHLQEHADDYLRLRRALGFKLKEHGRLLPQLVAYLKAVGATTVMSEAAIAWARLPEDAQPIYWAHRLTVARRFAAYMKAIDPATELPPRDVFDVRQRRPTELLDPRARQRADRQPARLQPAAPPRNLAQLIGHRPRRIPPPLQLRAVGVCKRGQRPRDLDPGHSGVWPGHSFLLGLGNTRREERTRLLMPSSNAQPANVRELLGEGRLRQRVGIYVVAPTSAQGRYFVPLSPCRATVTRHAELK